MWRNCIYLTCFDLQNNSFLFEYSFSSSTLSIASLLLLPSQERHSCLSIIFLAANALPTDRKPPWELNKAFAWTNFFNPLFLGFPLLSTGLSMFLKETYRLSHFHIMLWNKRYDSNHSFTISVYRRFCYLAVTFRLCMLRQSSFTSTTKINHIFFCTNGTFY